MNSSTKSTYPLFESVCVKDGIVHNAEYHLLRFEYAYKKLFWEAPQFDLFDGVEIPPKYGPKKLKLRISYGRSKKRFVVHPYEKRIIRSLKIVTDNTIDYDLKFEDRDEIDRLFEQRNTCDDILIIRNGEVTDSSYANIAFFDGTHWHTPSTPLLKGTKRTKLLQEEIIEETPIGLKNLKEYKGFQLINAMLDFEPNFFLPISNILI